jgi:MoaA/NifB/PqqE/SkfB family radical SAM enzyme
MKCGAFKAGLTVHPDGKASPCCMFDHRYFKDLSDLDMEDPWHDLMDGAGCSACINSEKPYRWQFDKFIYDDIYKNETDFKLRYLDVRNNNLCNFECSICNSYYSSKWAERLGEPQKFVKTTFDVSLEHIEQIYFAGGEPFLNPTHFEVIDSLPNKENVKLLYSSNLTFVDRIKEYANDFKSIQVNASIDAVGSYGEQIRKGLDWNRFRDNIDALSKFENVTVIISPTISLLNVNELDKIYEFAKNYSLKVDPVVLTGPDYLRISTLPESVKQYLRQKEFYDNHDIYNQLNPESSTNQFFGQAVASILLGDKLRKTNVYEYLCKTLPEFEKESLKVLK